MSIALLAGDGALAASRASPVSRSARSRDPVESPGAAASLRPPPGPGRDQAVAGPDAADLRP